MEGFEEIPSPIEPITTYGEDGSLEMENILSFQMKYPNSPGSIEDGALGMDGGCMERLLEIEADLMDFSPMDEDTIMAVDCFETKEMGTDEVIQEGQENDSPLAGGDSSLKEIEEELMEESSLTDLLLMGAEAVAARNWTFSSTIITKLNDLLFRGEKEDNSFNRLAFFFTQGLQHKSINAPYILHQQRVSRQPYSMSAFQVLHELSPYAKFAHFTANQAILEATQEDQQIHVVDFDIMDGIQWPPLMADLAMRKHASFRITAIIGDQQNTSVVQRTGRRLKEYADSINLSFEFEQMVMVTEDDFGSIEVSHAPIANCMIHQLHMPNRSFSLVKMFLGGMSRLSPKIVVLVEEELFNFSKISSMSFVEFFCEALHHYTALSDSLMSSFSGAYKMGLKLIEQEFFGIRILESLSLFPCEKEERLIWGDGFASLKRLRPIPMSSRNVSQANFLVSLFSGGFWVQHEKCRLILHWKSRPLTTASIWVPISKTR